MKLMHLSDLHLGKIVNGFSMLEDQKYILAQILEMARAEKPDGVLIAGDVYDRTVPSAEAVELLEMLKVDLGITTTASDDRLALYIENAQTEITREGVLLDMTAIGDMQLVVMYAAWTWRKRADGTGMPRMLRYALNNRLFSQKVKNG